MDDKEPKEDLKAKVSGWADQLTLRQKITLAVALVVTLGGLLWIAIAASQPEYRTLFNNLSPESAAKVVEVLDQNQIPYELAGGDRITVPTERVHEVRLMLAGQGLPRFEGSGMELFDETEFGMTAFTQKVNYQRAMENELARTIRHLEPVRQARVHLVLPEKTLFKEDQKQPTASIVLSVTPGATIGREQIKSMQNLVASAVEGLQPGAVSIVDQQGQMLAKPSDPGINGMDSGEVGEVVARMEQDYAQRVVELLEPLVGRDNVRAKVHVEVDSTQVTETAELFDPDKSVVRREQRTEESDTRGGPATEGAAGVTGQLQGAAAADAKRENASQRTQELVDYEINKTIRQTVQSGVRIKRVSVAVLFNDAKAAVTPEPASEGSEAEGAADAPEEGDTTGPAAADIAAAAGALAALDMTRVEGLVRSAVGYDEARGDRIEILKQRFHVAPADTMAPTPFYMEPGFITQAMRYALMALVAMMLSLFVLRPAAKALEPQPVAGAEKVQKTEMVVGRTVAEIESELVDAEVIDDEELLAKLLPVDPVREHQKVLREEIIELGSSDVDRTSQVISQWIRMG